MTEEYATGYANGYETGWNAAIDSTHDDTALLRQALEMLELALSSHKVLLMSDPPRWAWNEYGVEGKCRATIAALRERLGEKE